MQFRCAEADAMSAYGTKRTKGLFALMSPNDPKGTLLPARLNCS